jgi:hypothetical protein
VAQGRTNPTSVSPAAGEIRRRSFIAVLESRHDNRRIVSFRTAIESIWRLKPDPVRIGSTAAGESDWLAPDLSNFTDWYRAKVQEDPEASVALQVDLRDRLAGHTRISRLEPDRDAGETASAALLSGATGNA